MENYMVLQKTRHTSDKVVDELESILFRSKRKLLSFFEQLNRVMLGKNPATRINNARQVMNYYDRPSNDDDRFIYNFIEEYREDMFSEITLTDNMDTFTFQISASYEESYRWLHSKCCEDGNGEVQKHVCPISYTSSGYNTHFNTLNSQIQNTSDIDILLDAYYIIENNEFNEMSFVTFDNTDIISNKAHIETTLPGIFVFRPN